jgi:hypothetical protein
MGVDKVDRGRGSVDRLDVQPTCGGRIGKLAEHLKPDCPGTPAIARQPAVGQFDLVTSLCDQRRRHVEIDDFAFSTELPTRSNWDDAHRLPVEPDGVGRVAAGNGEDQPRLLNFAVPSNVDCSIAGSLVTGTIVANSKSAEWIAGNPNGRVWTRGRNAVELTYRQK